MKELAIAQNMIALARQHSDQGKKRSAMLRMIMPMLSKETGDKLASAISKKDSRHFIKLWDHIKHEITQKLDAEHRKHHPVNQHHEKHGKHHGHHVATASMGDISPAEWEAMHGPGSAGAASPLRREPTYADVTTFQRDDETAVCIQTYGPRKIRISLNGETINQVQPVTEVAPAVAAGELVPVEACPIEINGQSIGITTEQVCKLVKMVCERLLLGADPCPLPPRMMAMPENCAEHNWPDCKVCLNGLKGFDFHANILELYDKLCASSV